MDKTTPFVFVAVALVLCGNTAHGQYSPGSTGGSGTGALGGIGTAGQSRPLPDESRAARQPIPPRYDPSSYPAPPYDVAPARNNLAPGPNARRVYPPEFSTPSPPGVTRGFEAPPAARQARADLTQPQVNWHEFERARIMGQVADDVILFGDIQGLVDQQLAPYKGRVPESEFEQQRDILIRRQVRATVQRKILYRAFIRNIPPDRREEALGGVWEQVNKKFHEEELPKALEQAKAADAKELDQKLADFGWSLGKQIRTYGERQLGMYGVFQKVDRQPEVTHVEMLRKYRDDLDQYRIPAQARFEKLSVRFDRFDSKSDAHREIARMGDEIVLGGAPFWAVAKRSSHGINAETGGVHDWTPKGSLASDVVDEAIFTTPVGRMSRILEDDRGFHIIRVTERTDERFKPFVEAQADIKEAIQEEKRQAAIQKYVEQVQEEIPVWTIFDEEEEVASSNAGGGSLGSPR